MFSEIFTISLHIPWERALFEWFSNIPPKSSQRETRFFTSVLNISSLVPSWGGQKLCLLRNFLPQGVDHEKNRKLSLLKNSLPSGRHREGSKINHFDKFLFSPSKGSHRETPKIAGWIIFLCPSMGRARNIGFYALFSKIFCFRLQIGVSYQLLKERGSKLAQIFVCGIKIDAAFGSGISAVASKLMPFWLPPHLFPVGSAI